MARLVTLLFILVSFTAVAAASSPSSLLSIAGIFQPFLFVKANEKKTSSSAPPLVYYYCPYTDDDKSSNLQRLLEQAGVNKNKKQRINELAIIFHGAGGVDSNIDALSQSLSHCGSISWWQQLLLCLFSWRKQGSTKLVLVVDWSQKSSNTMKASSEGQRIGRDVACRLDKICCSLKPEVFWKLVHVVGVSVGAFAANSFVMEFQHQQKDKQQQQQKRRKCWVQLTLLDPFTLRSLSDFRYFGVRNFGKEADYAQQYMNTDDPVPSTNVPVNPCAVFDITPIRPSSIFGHDWPIVYYTRYLQHLIKTRRYYYSRLCLDIVPKSQRRSCGDVQIVEKQDF